MEYKEAGPEKQAQVEDTEMAETEPTAEAAAAAAPAAGAEAAAAAVPPARQEAVAVIEVEEEVEETQETEAREDGELGDDEDEEEEESETSEDLATHYHQVTDSQAALNDQWLLVLWSYQNEEVQAHHQMEGLEYWTKANDKAKAVNVELQKRGKQTLPPAKMFPRVFQHLAGMGMEVLSQNELDTGYADDDLGARLNQSVRDWDKESKWDAKEKRLATEKRFHQQKTAEKRDT